MKGNINMEKQKRITLNADKRKVIADVFQDHFESNSKYKKAWQEAIYSESQAGDAHISDQGPGPKPLGFV